MARRQRERRSEQEQQPSLQGSERMTRAPWLQGWKRAVLTQVPTRPLPRWWWWAEEAEAARAFGAHTYFCFNASASEDSILPVTAIGRGEKGGGARGGAAWILLYTCEMLLEHARPGMEQRGIFPEGQQLAATAVPLASVLTTLQGSAANAGVHINEFVPGLAPSAKATHLESEFLSRFLALAGA